MAPITRSKTNVDRAKGDFVYGRHKRCEVKVSTKKTEHGLVKIARKPKPDSKVGTTNTRKDVTLPGEPLRRSKRIYMKAVMRIAASAVVEIEDCCTQLGWLNKSTEGQKGNRRNQKHEQMATSTIADQVEVKRSGRKKASVPIRIPDWRGTGARRDQMRKDSAASDSVVEKPGPTKWTGALTVDIATQFSDNIDVGSSVLQETGTVKSNCPSVGVQFPEDSAGMDVAEQLAPTIHNAELPLSLSLPTRTGRRRCLSDSVLTFLNGSGCSGIPEHAFDVRHLIEHHWAGPLMVDAATQFPDGAIDGGPSLVIGFHSQESGPGDSNIATRSTRMISPRLGISPNLFGLLIGEPGSPQSFSPNMSYFSTPLDDTTVGERSAAMDSPERRYRSILSALDLPPSPDNFGQRFHANQGIASWALQVACSR